MCEYSLEFFREPHFYEGPEEVGKSVFLNLVNNSSPHPKLDYSVCVVASVSTQIRLRP